jgi:hypothetical protein
MKTVPAPDVAGMTEAISRKHPPHNDIVVLNNGVSGMLRSSRCILDTKGGEDNKLYCEKPDTKNAKLALINSLDLQANKWTAPKTVTVNKRSKAAQNLKKRNQSFTKSRQARTVTLRKLPVKMQKTIKVNVEKSQKAIKIKKVTPSEVKKLTPMKPTQKRTITPIKKRSIKPIKK